MIPYSVMTGLIKLLIPGLPAIKGFQPGKAPSLPYCSWREISSISQGRQIVNYGLVSSSIDGTFIFLSTPSDDYTTKSFSQFPDGSGGGTFGTLLNDRFIENTDIVKSTKVEIQFYTKTESQAISDGIIDYKAAYQYADDFTARLGTTASREYQETNDIGIIDWVDFSSFVPFLGDNLEQRAIIELTINYVQNIQDTIYQVNKTTTNLNLEGV